MSIRHYVHRITIEVTDEQYDVLKRHIEHGYMKRMFAALVDDVVVMLDEYGPMFVHAVLTKRVTHRGLLTEDRPDT